MQRRHVTRELEAPAEAVWRLLTNVAFWPDWGPSVSRVELDAPHLAKGVRGRVQTVVGLWLPFEITRFDGGRSWSWAVAGVPATDHAVEPLTPSRCRVDFGVPWVATPYLGVCAVALKRLDGLARRTAP